ncbi:MAG: hypothetical protein KQH63_14575 [Desulfobulbaceae bacterium]|nr:hypothetical protein [Desulfobulbaceae bacterium]
MFQIQLINSQRASLVLATEGDFLAISESVSEVSTLTAKNTTSSVEQVKGITQVNVAISEIDVVTQQNAANAEESAAAAEELNAQAEHMKDFVNELVILVNGLQRQKNKSEDARMVPEQACSSGE